MYLKKVQIKIITDESAFPIAFNIKMAIRNGMYRYFCGSCQYVHIKNNLSTFLTSGHWVETYINDIKTLPTKGCLTCLQVDQIGVMLTGTCHKTTF